MCYGLEETVRAVAQICMDLSKLLVSLNIYSEVLPVCANEGGWVFVPACKYGRRAVQMCSGAPSHSFVLGVIPAHMRKLS